jgi:hypothetical protein
LIYIIIYILHCIDLHCSKVIKIAGWNGAILSSCEQSNAGVTSWTPITSLPAAVQSPAMVTLLGKVYIFGGYNGAPQTSVRMYDGVSVWVSKAAMSPGREGHVALALDNDRALMCGGNIPATTNVNTCVIYTASTNFHFFRNYVTLKRRQS